MKYLQRRVHLAIGSFLLALIVAACGGQTVTLTINFTGDGEGVVTIAGGEEFRDDGSVTVAPGTPLTIRAAAEPGSVFGGFGGACSSDPDASCRVVVNENTTVEVNFVQDPGDTEATLELSFAGAGSGTVTIDSTDNGTDDGDEYSTDQTLTFPQGTVLSVSAEPADGSTFGGFGGACDGSDPCEITMDGDKSLTATFGVAGPAQFDVELTIAGNGSVAVSDADGPLDGSPFTAADSPVSVTVEEGTELTVVATPDADNSLGAFTGACDGTSGDTCTFTVTADAAVGVTFVADGMATVSVTAGRGLGSGTVTSDVGGLNCTVDSEAGSVTGDCSVSVNTTTATQVVLTATADTGDAFIGYGGDCDGDTCVVTISDGESNTVSAAFGLGTPASQEVTITLVGDDAEEFLDGSTVATNYAPGEIDNNTRYLELNFSERWNTAQTIGLIFRDLNIPAGADITRAVIEFSPYNASLDPSNAANPGFGAGSFDVSIGLHDEPTYTPTSPDSDPGDVVDGGFPDGGDFAGPDAPGEVGIISGLTVLGSVDWNVDGSAWANNGGANKQFTSDVSALLESWIDLGGYAAGANAAVFRLSSDNSDASNYAIATSQRGQLDPHSPLTQPDDQRAPTLIVEWQ